jgi:hypothetical protein
MGCILLSAKASGADVRMVYSPMNAWRFAERTDRVFLAVGFETTVRARHSPSFMLGSTDCATTLVKFEDGDGLDRNAKLAAQILNRVMFKAELLIAGRLQTAHNKRDHGQCPLPVCACACISADERDVGRLEW